MNFYLLGKTPDPSIDISPLHRFLKKRKCKREFFCSQKIWKVHFFTCTYKFVKICNNFICPFDFTPPKWEESTKFKKLQNNHIQRRRVKPFKNEFIYFCFAKSTSKPLTSTCPPFRGQDREGNGAEKLNRTKQSIHSAPLHLCTFCTMLRQSTKGAKHNREEWSMKEKIRKLHEQNLCHQVFCIYQILNFRLGHHQYQQIHHGR